MQMLGVTINILSLGGLALAVGLLIDNAIVVAEATGRLREEGVPVMEAVRRGTDEVSGPLIAGTLTTLLVFGPIVFVQGLAAALFRDLSISVVVSVGASLILALTVMPVMLTWGRRKGEGRREKGEGTEATFPFSLLPSLYRFGVRMADLYERGVAWSLRRPATVFGITLATIAVTLLLL